jgi:hypothetical protein
MRKLLGWAALAIAVIWTLHNPAQAAADIHQAVHALSVLASAL